ncbi:MAG: hypothetical protein WD208_08495 [Dehalococcoidia bacterium]
MSDLGQLHLYHEAMNHLKNISRVVALLVIGALALVGCAVRSELVGVEGFSTVMSDDDGRAVEFAGVPTGHESGEDSSFVVVLQIPEEAGEGTAPDRWVGTYCFKLMNEAGLVESYPGETFDVKRGESVTENLNVRLPDDLSPGAYLAGVAIMESGVFGSATFGSAIFVDMGPSRGEIPEVWPSIPTSCD